MLLNKTSSMIIVESNRTQDNVGWSVGGRTNIKQSAGAVIPVIMLLLNPIYSIV